MWVADTPTQLNSHAGGCRPYPSMGSYPDEIELVRVPGFLRQWIRVVQDPCVGGWKSQGQPYPKFTMLPPPLVIMCNSAIPSGILLSVRSPVCLPPSQTPLAQ